MTLIVVLEIGILGNLLKQYGILDRIVGALSQLVPSKKVKQDEELDKIRNMLFFLYDYFLKNPEKLPKERLDMVDEWGLEEVVKDQIAGMTDRYAVNMFSEIFIPKGWR